MKALRRSLFRLIRRACAIKPKRIDATTITAELTLDSLSYVKLIVDIEDAFQIAFPDEALNLDYFATVGNLQDAVLRLVQEKE